MRTRVGTRAHKNVEEMSLQEVIEAYLPLVKSIAGSIIARCPANVELDDLVNVGVIGLMDAAERFSSAYGKPFRSYAELRIRGEILDELRSNDWVPRSTRKKFERINKVRRKLERERGPGVSDREVADALGINLETYHQVTGRSQTGNFLSFEDLGVHDDEHRDLLEALKGDSPEPDALLRVQELEGILAKAISELPHRERITVYLYYYQELSQKEIGRILGVTESRVSQIHTKALGMLKRKVSKMFA